MTRSLSLVLALVCASACAGRDAARGYRSLDELEHCRPGECVEAELEFTRWADAPHFAGRMPYYCDPGSELDGRPDRSIERVIIVLHGVVGETPQEFAAITIAPGLNQFRNVERALGLARERNPSLDPSKIAILSPNFQRSGEWQPWTDADPRMWTWARSTWNMGARAREGRRADAVSSFDVLDEFLRAARIKFPNATQFILTGHSSGGQTVHRYALLGVGVHEQLASEGVALRYVVANPGTYAFPLQRRKLQPGSRSVRPGVGQGDTRDWSWGMPQGCADWDTWGYGLDDLAGTPRAVRAVEFAIATYLEAVDRKAARRSQREVGSAPWQQAGRQALLLQYAAREIWHLQASGDTDSTFARDCKATLEGRSRFERFSNFQDAWQRLLDVPAPDLHFVAIDGLGDQHSARAIYASDAGRHVLFE